MKTVELLGYCGKCGYSVDSDFCYRCQRLVENKIMTKKQIHSKINEEFYTWVTNHYPWFEMDFSEGYGRVYFTQGNNLIEYHQSRHEVETYRYSDEATHDAVANMNTQLDNLKNEYSL